MNSLPKACDVLIVGAGPVGMAMANLLARQGVSGIIVDRALKIFEQPRAIALDNEALRILQWTGLDDSSFKRIGIASVHFKSPLFGEVGRVNAAGVIDCHPKLVTFFQPELEEALDKQLQESNNFSLHRGISISHSEQVEGGVQVKLTDQAGEHHNLLCQYLIAADGANSSIRKSLGLDFKGGKKYDEDWLIVDVKDIHQSRINQPQDHIEFICDPQRAVPHMPAPGDRERWEFKLRKNENPEKLMEDKNINKLLEPWFPHHDAHIERKAVYRFQAKTAPKFSKGNTFLIGDAAHVTPPFVGQGLVAGLRDAANLSWKIASVLKGNSHDKILDSYDVERRPHAKAMIRLAVLTGKVVMPQNKLAAFVSHGIVKTMSFLPVLKNQLQELEIKPKNAFHKGLFISGKNRLKRGHPIMQTPLSNNAGEVKNSDDIAKGKFRLMGFGFHPEKHLSTTMIERWQDFGGESLQICHRNQVLNRPNKDCCWEDMQGDLLPNAVPMGWLVIVRPDQVVMHEGPIEDAEKILEQVLEKVGFSQEQRLAVS
ncbi:MAG: FAD-dependent monooxygenase [Bermanella sp.]